MRAAIKVSEKFHQVSKSEMHSLVTKMLNVMDKTHAICHEVAIQDAKIFYDKNPYMHECIDKIIESVNGIRVSVSSRPVETHGEIHLLEHPLQSFEEMGKSVEYCLSKFEIFDL